MISIIITAWEEPDEVKECLRYFISQKHLDEDYEVLVTAPDKPTADEVKKWIKKYPKKIKFILQPREKGKNEMLNLLMEKAKGDILIFTDGDIFVNDITISEILKYYKDPKIGAVTGRIAPINSRETLLGFWAHLLTNGAHLMRRFRFKKRQFVECSGYLFSVRKKLIEKIPLDVAEDSIIPLIVWKKGYKIGYAEKAIARVLYPEKFSKWLDQKIRCAKSHEKLDSYGAKKIRMKTLKNEILKGSYWAITYPVSLKELFWTILLFLVRFHVWVIFFIETRIKNRHYGETWKKIHTFSK